MKRVLLVEDLPQVAQHLQSMLAREKEVEIAGVQNEADAAIAQITTEKPDVVLIDALMQGKVAALDIAKRVRAVSPGTRIIMVTVPQKPLDAKAEATIDAVFVLPGGANELAEVLGVGKAARPQHGHMVAVYSPKGGTGKTTLAVNLAVVLRRQGKSVALMDGVMQFGAVRHAMQIPPATRSFVDLPTAGAMRTSLAEVLWEGPSGVHVLLAPAKPEEVDLVQGNDIGSAMNMLAESHDYVIVDTPSRLTEDALAILDAASTILMVVTYQNATVANSRSAIDTFEALGYKGRKPILLVVNQADTAGGMSKTAVEHALNLPIVAEIPTDWKTVSDSLNKQQPFVLASPQAPVSRAVEALAHGLVTQQRK
ncbi:MAG TPA: P-loop NTPase [Candidatus Limnocylindria bacterium]|jgi:pilus assembly protein CpaE|nr:P-loop NTPase [Candidatus Limnocylindria bacterium]